MLAAFYWVIDVCGFRRWSLPLAVVGANSIAIYLMAQLMKPFVAASIRTHFGREIFDGPNGPLVRGLGTSGRLLADLPLALQAQDFHQNLMRECRPSLREGTSFRGAKGDIRSLAANQPPRSVILQSAEFPGMRELRRFDF